MEAKVLRWENPEPPTENRLREIYRQEGLNPYIWSNEPGDTYVAHAHPYHKIIYVVEGSITWVLPDSCQEMDTQPGDRLELPSGVVHAARVGPKGVICLEAHRQSK